MPVLTEAAPPAIHETNPQKNKKTNCKIQKTSLVCNCMTKNVFVSKTAAVALITTASGIVANFVPEVGEYVTANAAMILMGLGVVSFILRLVTKGAVSLFPQV
jgi:hypothetical protein